MAFVPGYPVYMQPVVNGATSKSVYLYITAASGLPVAGLAFDTAGLLASYAGTKLARVAITLADLAAITTAWASGGFKEVDGTNMPGWYRLDIPNAALALSADEVVVTIVKDAVCQSSLVIPIPTVTNATISTKVDTVDTEVGVIDGIVDNILLDTAEIGTVAAGTVGDVIDAVAAAIPNLDVVAITTTRTDS